MQKKNLRAFLDYLPAAVTALLSVVTLILYLTVISEHKVSDYLAIGLIPLIPFAMTILSRKFKLGIPRYLIILICLHFVLAVDAGTVIGLYGQLSWWDLMLHGFFGFWGCAIFYYLYFRFEKQAPKPGHYVIFVLLTISLGAIWEMYEFVASFVFHSDMQCVEEALAQGISPLTDTMTDLMIAVVGAVLFYAVPLIKKLSAPKSKKAPDGENQK